MTDELPHVRCIGCGYPISWKWNQYQELLGSGVSPEEALNQVGLTRYCCRMWMQSPFKIPVHSERQIDPRDTGLEEQRATLNVVGAQQPTLAPLQAMDNPEGLPQAVVPQAQEPIGGLPGFPTTQPTQAYTVVPLVAGTEVGLPAIPEVALPALATLGAKKEEKSTVTRVYHAW